jgi:glycosyltransferase involved in cell wall biosynthesis
MRVALVTYALNVGGMESFLFLLAHGLRSVGHEVTFVVTEAIGAWHHRPEEQGYEVHAILPSKWSSKRTQVRRTAAVLSQYDAVLLNHSREAQAGLGLLPDDVAVLSILHNDFSPVYEVGLKNSTNLDAVVAVSSRVYVEAIRRGAPATRTTVARCGVEVPSQWPKAASAWTQQLRVCFLGRVTHSQKGVLDIPFILSAAQANGCELSLDLVGSGPDLEELVRSFARQCPGLSLRVHGALPHTEAMAILESCHVLIMPSRFEGLPVVLLEAMARGVVPVVSHLPGITDEAVIDGETGRLVKVGDLNAFALAISDLTRSATWAKYSYRAWEETRQRFSSTRMASDYSTLIEECWDRRVKGSAWPRTGRIEGSLLGRGQFFPCLVVDGARTIRALTTRIF